MSWKYEPYFTRNEMRCKCGECDGVPLDSFMEKLFSMRVKCGFPFPISSAYRCPKYNAIVSTTGEGGPHTLGLAADIKVYGERALLVLEAAIAVEMTGLGISQKGAMSKRFIHVDNVLGVPHIPRPFVWSY